MYVAASTIEDSAALLPAGVNLTPAGPEREQDWARIASYLQRQGFRIDLSFTPRRFAGGLANLNYLMRLEAGDWVVLRRPPPGPLPAGAHDMVREHSILHRLCERLPLAPRSFHLCQDPAIAGAPFQLLEYRSGVTVRGDSLQPFEATEKTGRNLSTMLVEGLAAIHAVDPADVGLEGLGRPQNFLARNIKGWIDRAARISGGAMTPAAVLVADWLKLHGAGPGGDGTLLHNDFKLDNLLLNPQTGAPVAILDWDMGTRGDALLDLATLLSYWTEAGDPPCMHALAQMPTAKPGFMTRVQAAEAYSRNTGRSLDGFKVYRVLAMFKLAVVFQQLHARHRSGEVSDARYAAFGELADDLFAFTRSVAEDNYF